MSARDIWVVQEAGFCALRRKSPQPLRRCARTDRAWAKGGGCAVMIIRSFIDAASEVS